MMGGHILGEAAIGVWVDFGELLCGIDVDKGCLVGGALRKGCHGGDGVIWSGLVEGQEQ